MFCALFECWTCKWYFAFKLISLHVRMFISYVNEHYGHYSIVIACMVKPWFIALFHFAWSDCACFICIIGFLHTMIKLCCCVSRDTCSYDSRASQILELGVSEHYDSRAYWLACPDVHFICEWALWSLFYSDCLYGQAMFYCFIPFCLIALCLLHMHYKFFCI